MGLSSSMLNLIGNCRGTPGTNNNHDDRPRELNRYMGGHRRANHPYINGYWYLLIEPPQFLFDESDINESGYQLSGTGEGYQGGRNGAGAFESSRWLHSTAEGFTPPTRTLTKVDVPGMGGMGSSFVAGQQLTRTFSTTHREYQNTTVFNTVNLWTSVIDHHYGISPMKGTEYVPANYKGSAYVFLCKPTTSKGGGDGKGAEGGVPQISHIDVEQFYFFEGVFPEGSPYDAFNSDINTNDVVQLNVTWSFDGWPYGREHTSHFNTGIALLQETYAYDFAGNINGHIGDNVTAPATLNAPTVSTSSFGN